MPKFRTNTTLKMLHFDNNKVPAVLSFLKLVSPTSVYVLRVSQKLQVDKNFTGRPKLTIIALPNRDGQEPCHFHDELCPLYGSLTEVRAIRLPWICHEPPRWLWEVCEVHWQTCWHCAESCSGRTWRRHLKRPVVVAQLAKAL